MTQSAKPEVRIAPNNPVFDLPVIVGIEEGLFAKAGLDVSILEAKVESIQERTLGLMIAELIGSAEETARAIAYLETHDLDVEVLGHVQRDA